MTPIEWVPLVVALLGWGVGVRLASRVEVDRSPPGATEAVTFDDVVVTTEAPVGYKAAQVVAGAHDAWFAGISHQVYGVDDAATCHRRGCQPPATDCRCGFYAFTDEIDAVEIAQRLSGHPVRAHAVLQVEMSGEVLAFERGVRGAHQRVLRVEFARRCHRCAGRGRQRPAVGLGADRRDRGRQLWCDLRPRVLASLPGGSAPVRPLCADHLDRASRRLAPADLAGLLGTEVRWRPESVR